MGKIISTLVTVVVAVGACAALWIGANLMFNQVRYHWTRFSALAFGTVGFLIGVILSGNQLTVGSAGGFLNWVWLPAVLALASAGIGAALAETDDPKRRMAIGTGGGAVLGVGLGALIDSSHYPSIEIGALLGFVAGWIVVCVVLAKLFHGHIVNGALIGGAMGWLWGAWFASDLGGGTALEAIVATAVPFVLIGVRLGRATNPDIPQRARIDNASRAVIFIGPALLFISIALVVPTLRTIYLSFFDRTSVEFVGLDNYRATFTDPNTWDASGFSNFFTSQLFYIGMALLVIALLLGIRSKRATGRAVELGNATSGPLIVGGLLLAFALFTALRGTIVNNLWWVVTVTCASTSLGLAVAVLADKRRGEKFAKSIIFMPMAISLVGAAIIWRFMYQSRDVSQNQTGVLNAVWVGLGRLSNGSGWPTLIVAVMAGIVLVSLVIVVARYLVRQQYSRAVLPGILAIFVGWFFFRYVGSGIGGFTTAADGEVVPQTVFFLQEIPYNSFWLMVILIWIQVGFSMVILSAAIKAVPDELIEAARIDGATTSQIFWRVTLPQIATTIGVVVTTLIVLVMKVFDIVKVTTNGQFGSQVLANDMYQRAFGNFDTGRGAALAVILFVAVLPVMYFNIRRTQEA
ncbi:MAG: sugar ABC transporter permease [Acidimicrobiales bacterium]|nr:MAG: sugar ABC transporter permease [Acidimicrobiales bacterium]